MGVLIYGGIGIVVFFLFASSSSLALECSKLNRDCAGCVQNSSCYYCKEDATCQSFAVSIKCPGLRHYIGQCTVPAYGFVIIVVFGVVIIFTICCFVCLCICCALRKRRKRYQLKEEAMDMEWKSDTKKRYADRRADLKVKYDEMRTKYNIPTTDSHSTPYTKLK